MQTLLLLCRFWGGDSKICVGGTQLNAKLKNAKYNLEFYLELTFVNEDV